MASFEIQVTEVSPVERDVHVTASEDQVRAKFSEVFADVAKSASIKGFRAGHVPRNLLLQRFRKDIVKDLANDLLREGYEQALQENHLDPVAMPSLDKPENFDGEGPFSFSFRVEVEPKVENVKLDGLKVERERVVVTDDAVEHELGHLRERHAAMRTVEGRTLVEASDWVYVDFDGSIDGKPLEGGKQARHLMNLRDSNLITGFAEQIVGQTVGQPFEVRVTFPADYHAEHLRSKDAVFACKVDELTSRVLPDLNDDFAKDLGKGSLDELKASVRADLEKAATERAQRQFKDKLWQAVVEANPLPLPPSLIERHTQSMLEDQLKRLKMYGIDPSNVGLKPDEMIAKARKDAELAINALYLQEHLAEEHKIEAKPAEVDAKYSEMAAEFNMPVEQVRAYYEEKHGDGLRYSIRLDKLTAFIASKVEVVEVDPKPIEHDHDHDHE